MAGRVAWWAFGPGALLVAVWICWGRIPFGIAGWGILIYPLVVTPVMLLFALPVAITVMCSPIRPWRFARFEVATVAAAGTAGALLGLAVPDASDAPDSTRSLLGEMTGVSVGTSETVAIWCALVGCAALLLAFILAVVRVSQERRVARYRAMGPPPPYAPGPPPDGRLPPSHQRPPSGTS